MKATIVKDYRLKPSKCLAEIISSKYFQRVAERLGTNSVPYLFTTFTTLIPYLFTTFTTRTMY